MLSLFVVNANLAPVVSWEKQRQVTQAKALAQTHQGSLWAAVRDFICSSLFFFFLSRVCFFHFFYSEELEIDRPAWREESPLAWFSSTSLFCRRPPSLCSTSSSFLLGPLPQARDTLCSSFSLGDLRSLKAVSAHSCFQKVTRDSPGPYCDGTVTSPCPPLAAVLAWPARVCWQNVLGP